MTSSDGPAAVSQPARASIGALAAGEHHALALPVPPRVAGSVGSARLVYQEPADR